MDKIKVIDFATTSQGAWRLLYSRVNKINSDSRISNIIVCPDGDEISLIKKGGVDVRTMRIERGLGMINVLNEMSDFYRILKSEKPSVIHTHNSKAGAIGRLMCFLYNKTHKEKIYIIHQVHGYHFTKFSGFKRKLFYELERWLSRFTDSLFFQNRYEFELTQKFGFKKLKLELIGNGINFSEMKKNAEKTSRELKNIICIARIEPVKNHEMIIRSAALLKKKTDKYIIYIIGEGETEPLVKLAEKLDVKEKIVFTGK
jgi:glycosyltransferase involved in cell wall biosynthesis